MTGKTPRQEGEDSAQRDLSKVVTTALVGLAALLIVWPSIKEFVQPVWENTRRISSLERDMSEINKKLDEIIRFFPRHPTKVP